MMLVSLHGSRGRLGPRKALPLCRLRGTTPWKAANLTRACFWVLLALDLDAHRPGGAGDDLLGGLDVVGVEVRQLRLGDAAKLRRRDRADLRLVRLAGPLVDARGLLDQLRRRRRLRDEREGAVLEDRDLDRDDVAPLALRGSVVLPYEVHDVDAVRAQRGADGRGRGGLAGRQLHLDDSGELLPSWRHGTNSSLRSW